MTAEARRTSHMGRSLASVEGSSARRLRQSAAGSTGRRAGSPDRRKGAVSSRAAGLAGRTDRRSGAAVAVRAGVARERAGRSNYNTRKQQAALSENTLRNREKANGIGKGYVIAITVICCAILFSCIRYLQLQTQITAVKKQINSLETTYSQIKEDNDAYESQVTSNIDLDAIKKVAIGRLDMKYPSDEQIRTYETEGRSYVRQFQDVPGLK